MGRKENEQRIEDELNLKGNHWSEEEPRD